MFDINFIAYLNNDFITNQSYYIMYQRRSMDFYRSSEEFTVQIEGEQARAEDKYCKHTRSKSTFALGAGYTLTDTCIDF